MGLRKIELSELEKKIRELREMKADPTVDVADYTIAAWGGPLTNQIVWSVMEPDVIKKVAEIVDAIPGCHVTIRSTVQITIESTDEVRERNSVLVPDDSD